MIINHDKSYLSLYRDIKETGFTVQIIDKIRFDGDRRDSRSEKAIHDIKDWLESNFKMYQYKDNGIKYGEHELFYWSNGGLYFTIDYNKENSFESYNELTEKIVRHITDNYSDIAGYMSLQYKECTDWQKVNDYISSLVIDYNNFPYSKLSPICNKMYTGDWKYLSKENADKLYEVYEKMLNSLIDKKVVFNGIKGTLRKLSSGEYGVFKPRATRHYYSVEMNNIRELVMA